jgi:hypothetical protein
MQIINGKIVKVDETGLYIYAPFSDIDRFIICQYEDVQVGLEDGRRISPEQRKKAYALLNEIGEWQGEHTETMKRILKLEFITNRMRSLAKEMFSLSDCDMTLAREFISFLIDFVVEWGVPTQRPILELCEDVRRAVYACLMNKQCILCGRKAQLHHVDAIGMGRDRTEILQLGMRVAPLCDAHHIEVHTRGVQWLLKDMHVEPVGLTKEIGKVYGLTKKNLEAAG